VSDIIASSRVDNGEDLLASGDGVLARVTESPGPELGATRSDLLHEAIGTGVLASGMTSKMRCMQYIAVTSYALLQSTPAEAVQRFRAAVPG
jgi:hypothetical protein